MLVPTAAELINRYPQLLPCLVSSSAYGFLVGLRKLVRAVRGATLAGLRGLPEVHRALCECVSKCDANQCRLRTQLAEHRRDLKDLVPRQSKGRYRFQTRTGGGNDSAQGSSLKVLAEGDRPR